MKTALVARLALAGLVAATLGSPAFAQDASDDSGDFTHPRERRERVRNQGGTLNLRAPQRAAVEEPPKLGVYIDVTDDGLIVGEVMEGSLAASAGVQASDILLSLDGRRLNAIEDIRAALAQVAPGDDVEIAVIREGAGLVKLSAQLARREIEKQEARERADGHQGGFLGVELGDSTDHGVLIAGVVDGTAAWYAGLDSGDILLAIDGEAVSSGQDVAGAIASRAPGTMVTLAYARDGEKMEGRIRLGNRMTDGMRELEEMLRGGQNAPFGMALPHGQGQRLPLFFGQGDGDGPDVFFGKPGGNVLHLDPDQLKSHTLKWQGHGEEMGEWIENLTEPFEDLGVEFDGDGPHAIRISIEDGKVTIERDGEIQEYDLENASSIIVDGNAELPCDAAGAECDVEAECGVEASSCCEAEAECEAGEAVPAEAEESTSGSVN